HENLEVGGVIAAILAPFDAEAPAWVEQDHIGDDRSDEGPGDHAQKQTEHDAGKDESDDAKPPLFTRQATRSGGVERLQSFHESSPQKTIAPTRWPARCRD